MALMVNEQHDLSPLYIAGLFDGCGHLAIRERKQKGRSYYAVKVALCIADIPLLKKVQAQYGGTIPNTKQITLEWYGREGIKKLLSDIQPHLWVIVEKAQEMLDLIEGQETK